MLCFCCARILLASAYFSKTIYPAARNVSHVLTFQPIPRWFDTTYKQKLYNKSTIPNKRMITTMFFVLVPFLKRAPRIIVHLARNVEKLGGALMSIILPNLKHLFICPVPVPDFLVFHTPFSCNRCVRFSFDIKGSLGCWRALTLSCAPNNV